MTFAEIRQRNEGYAHRLLALLNPVSDEQRVDILAAFFRDLDGADIDHALLAARAESGDDLDLSDDSLF